MGIVIRPERFKRPIKNTRHVYTRKPGAKNTGVRRLQVQLPIYLMPKVYRKLQKKAEKECGSAAPVHDILMLLLYYYLENRFIVHRSLVCVDDPTIAKEISCKRIATYNSVYGPYTWRRKVWLRLTKKENTKLTNKMKHDRITKNLLFHSLIEFYLTYKFIVKTKIIRTTIYRTGNEETDVQLADPIEQKKVLTTLRDSMV